jgi:DNA polymerase I-like protein with 3'-5' exonuclease and polymerase domains
LLLNQEHDKFIFDVKVSVLEEALPFIKETMEAAPEIMEKIYGVKMPCRTPVSVKVGRDLGHMEKL